MPFLHEASCGASAAMVNISVTYPLNKVIFRQQIHALPFRRAFWQVHAEGGWKLYRGVLPPMMQKSASMSLMFGLYAQYRETLQRKGPAWIQKPFMLSASAAFLAGTTEAILTPFERVQTLLQHHKYHGQLRNTAHAFCHLRTYGFREYYRGVVPILCRNGPSNILFFSLRDPISKDVGRLMGNHDSNVALGIQNFISGAVLGAGLSTLFFPLNVVKNKMQCRLGGTFFSLPAAAMYVFQERGWRLLYRGVHVNFTRSLLSWGITNMSYECFRSILLDLR
ncbi:mitochondrial nicotinamide adenine dinucleotide transporter SLC25A51-like [Sycon ciliatum]|uniref:mitochondrial nicotinamide adenine dinucleotide transporter SLC25A51-like n=1 Tax=Sycon ciliatum TaxID=27933 RepID=UPI0020ACB9D8|eukprot:scpid62553/ scgid16996/ Solute carrier family 25 member 51; Mitochondrial carrier triple repeat protein 1